MTEKYPMFTDDIANTTIANVLNTSGMIQSAKRSSAVNVEYKHSYNAKQISRLELIAVYK